MTLAFYRSLQTKGVKEDIKTILENLESFAFQRMQECHEDGRNKFEVTDFHKCEMTRLKNVDNKRVHYKLLIKQLQYTKSGSDRYSNYSGHYEHILFSKQDCLRVISDVTREGNKYFLCRNHIELGIPRKERLPEINVSKVDMMYQVDIVYPFLCL